MFTIDVTQTGARTRTVTMRAAIDALNFAGNTGTAQALWQGYQQIVTINEVGALNVIVFFTDGRPTAITADFPVKTLADQRYGDGSSTYPNTSSLYTTGPYAGKVRVDSPRAASAMPPTTWPTTSRRASAQTPA
jgi:hypothetical protein